MIFTRQTELLFVSQLQRPGNARFTTSCWISAEIWWKQWKRCTVHTCMSDICSPRRRTVSRENSSGSTNSWRSQVRLIIKYAVSYITDGSCYLGSCATFLLRCVTAEIMAAETGEWQPLMRKIKYHIYSTSYNTTKVPDEQLNYYDYQLSTAQRSFGDEVWT